MKNLFSILAVIFVLRDGIPMMITNVSQEEIQSQGVYQIIDKATYDTAVAALTKPIIVNLGPTIEDRLLVLETHQTAQDVAIQAVATKTGTPIVLPASSEVVP